MTPELPPVSYFTPGEVTSPRFAFVFAQGCQGAITEENELFDGPAALFGSPSKWPVLRQAQAAGRDWYYGDHGYFRRGEYFRVTRNAYQHDGVGAYAPDRFALMNRPVLPWKRGRNARSKVLVCPNSDVYMGLHGMDGPDWLRGVLATLRQHTDRPIQVRWKKTAGTHIQGALEDAWAVVVFSSAAALDALIHGVPVFVLAPFAAGARMGLSDLSQIEAPFYPDDREPFLWALAYQQWTFAEIMKGEAWRALQEERARRAESSVDASVSTPQTPDRADPAPVAAEAAPQPAAAPSTAPIERSPRRSGRARRFEGHSAT